jgi:hypothetical protein
VCFDEQLDTWGGLFLTGWDHEPGGIAETKFRNSASKKQARVTYQQSNGREWLASDGWSSAAVRGSRERPTTSYDIEACEGGRPEERAIAPD